MTENLTERLSFYNPWWTSGQVPPALNPPFKRQLFTKLRQYLALDRVIVLKGPRRVGKSTLYYQLIANLFEKGVKPAEVLYLSFDDPLLRGDLFKILEAYEKFSGQPLSSGNLKYVFLDEVQFLPEWSAMVKTFYDKKLPLKFLVSGSAASLLVRQTETLAGRTIEETLLPLNFSEWLAFWQDVKEEPSLLGNQTALAFQNYRQHSGFLHLLAVPEKELWTKMLQEDVVTKAIYKDSVEIFGLREPAVLEKMFAYLSSSTSGLASMVKLSSMLGIDRVQASKYLAFLENTLLVFPLRKYSPQVRDSLRSMEKIHLVDQGFGQIYPSPTSGILESIVARHLWEKHGNHLYFWRDRQEVDLVIEADGSLLPIEVKDSMEVDKRGLGGLLAFAKKFGQTKGVVVYMGEAKEVIWDGVTVKFVPVWDFLLNLV